MEDSKFQVIKTDHILPNGSNEHVTVGEIDCSSFGTQTLTIDSFASDELTVTGKLLPLINSMKMVDVKAYGALGNGVSDDTDAINKAIDYIKLNGGCLYLPSGTYLISKSINIGGNTKPFAIKGSGWDTIIKRNFNFEDPIHGNEISNAIIEDLYIDGNIGTFSSPTNGITLIDQRNMLVRNVKVYNVTNHGITFSSLSQTDSSWNTNNWITNCVFDGCNTGISFIKQKNSGIASCVIRNTTSGSAGIWIKTSQENFVRQCYFENCASIGIKLSENTVLGHNIISDCSFDNVTSAITVLDESGDVISNVLIDMKDTCLEALRVSGSTSSNRADCITARNFIVKNVPSAVYPFILSGYVDGCLIELDLLNDDTQTKVFQIEGSTTSNNLLRLNALKNQLTPSDISSFYTGTLGSNELIIRGNNTFTKRAPLWQAAGFENTSTTNQDFLSALHCSRTLGSNVPAYSQITLPTGGNVGGMYAYIFPSNLLKEIFFTGVLLPNDWREGSTVYPKATFLLTGIPSSSSKDIRIKFDYSVLNNAAAVSTTVLSSTIDLDLNTLGITQEGYILEVDLKSGGISMTDKLKDTLMECRLAREVLAGNYYTGNVYLVGFGLAYNKKYLAGQ